MKQDKNTNGINTTYSHIPVLENEVLKYLLPQDGGRYIDATVGFGGHALALLKENDKIQLLGLDRDEDAVNIARSRLREFESRVKIFHANYSSIDEISRQLGWDFVDGIFLDLGVSSYQIDNVARGFSFQSDGPLDMRMDQKNKLTASDLVNHSSYKELKTIFYEYGEESKSSVIANAIIRNRTATPFTSTLQLSRLIRKCTGIYHSGYHSRVARCFQGLRIAVNDEFGHLRTCLDKLTNLLSSNGRFVAISFHSLEDRIIKNWLRMESKTCVCPPGLPICVCKKQASMKMLTKKPVMASEMEKLQNKRSKSAKLRAAVRL